MRHIEIIEGTNIAHFRWKGSITHTQRFDNMDYIFEFCNQNNIRRLLLDLSETLKIETPNLSTSYKLARKARRVFKDYKVAALYKPSSIEIEFIKNFITMRLGNNIRRFSNYDEALAWLKATNGKHLSPVF